jgi:hypothetical protein
VDSEFSSAIADAVSLRLAVDRVHSHIESIQPCAAVQIESFGAASDTRSVYDAVAVNSPSAYATVGSELYGDICNAVLPCANVIELTRDIAPLVCVVPAPVVPPQPPPQPLLIVDFGNTADSRFTERLHHWWFGATWRLF